MSETLEELAQRIARHSLVKHKEKFHDPCLGPVIPIELEKELARHVVEILESKETQCFSACSGSEIWRHADFFYHSPTNTLVVVPPDPENEPTAYRPKKFEVTFIDKIIEATEFMSHQVEIKHGIYELHPEMKELQIARQQEDEKQRKAEQDAREKEKSRDSRGR